MHANAALSLTQNRQSPAKDVVGVSLKCSAAWWIASSPSGVLAWTSTRKSLPLSNSSDV